MTAGDVDNMGDIHKRPIAAPASSCAFIHDPSDGRGKKAKY